MNTLLDAGELEHRCPHCLYQPLSVVAHCLYCRGTGLKARFIKRPGLPPPIVTETVCETCWETKTTVTENNPHQPFRIATRVTCRCGVFVDVQHLLDPEKSRSRPTVSLLFSEMTHADYCAQLKRETAERYGWIPTQRGFRRPNAGAAV